MKDKSDLLSPEDMIGSSHTPVMCREMLNLMRPHTGGTYLDATFGRGGYTRALIEEGAGHVIALDRDAEAIAWGKKLVKMYGKKRLTLIHARFSQIASCVDLGTTGKLDGVIFDLGVSSPQLETEARGFSFQTDGPLDMAMGLTKRRASQILNSAPIEELAQIFWELGEEKASRRLAHAIVEARQTSPLKTTQDLVRIILSVARPSKNKIHPATRVFQALRIWVNEEIEELESGLEAVPSLLKAGGRLVVVSFHSLEDRIVKRYMRRTSGRIPAPSRHHLPLPERFSAPPLFSCDGKTHRPSATEIRMNPRARSAQLRWAERLG